MRAETTLRKATTALAARYETVVAEDLNMTGMISNKAAHPGHVRPGLRDHPRGG